MVHFTHICPRICRVFITFPNPSHVVLEEDRGFIFTRKKKAKVSRDEVVTNTPLRQDDTGKVIKGSL
jgi:hypothetical protein